MQTTNGRKRGDREERTTEKMGETEKWHAKQHTAPNDEILSARKTLNKYANTVTVHQKMHMQNLGSVFIERREKTQK